MSKWMKLFVVASVVALAGCTDAQVVSNNLSRAAEMFEIDRRIVFFNGITGNYLLVLEGRCSIETQYTEKQLEVTCKLGHDEYYKHHLGLSDNVSYFSEQIEPSDVNAYHYRVVIKPQTLIPNIDVR